MDWLSAMNKWQVNARRRDQEGQTSVRTEPVSIWEYEVAEYLQTSLDSKTRDALIR